MYNRPSIMLSKSKKQVDKNLSLAQKEQELAADAMKKKQQKMMAIHEHRRIQMFGSKEEQKSLKSSYKGECDMQVQLQKNKAADQHRRDWMETDRCNNLFQQEIERERRREQEKALARKRVAEENMMMAQNKRKSELTSHQQNNLKNEQIIHNSKFSVSTMIR